jgi:hypothetical protein
MFLLVPCGLIFGFYFVVAVGLAALLSAKAAAMMLCVLVPLAIFCRGRVRLVLVMASLLAVAARYAVGGWGEVEQSLSPILPLVITLGGVYLIVRSLLGPRRHRCCTCQRGRDW